MNINELSGDELDYQVAVIEGMVRMVRVATIREAIGSYSPSTKWEHGGPIIEREFIELQGCNQGFAAEHYMFDDGGERFVQRGPTPLVAAMRAYVASKHGDTVPGEARSSDAKAGSVKWAFRPYKRPSALRGLEISDMTSRERWIYEESRARHLARYEPYKHPKYVMLGESGVAHGYSFVIKN